MIHFHVCTGPLQHIPVTDVKFEEYEASIQCFVSLSNAMFKELRGSDYDLTIEQALEATDRGNNAGAFVGPPSLMIYWLRCEATTHDVPSWN